ncbi:spore coat associated protein CotJA [Clostridium sp. D2Q-14]|uniref:spore coat associated protein CotJA n=1 Tax=Anaeromonas gelatinilytica TaxID=2683194 RepID=UPI00193B58E6|nr:spore coat associated protein CotJA [Anaeromonas gelatinilytica]MBS4534138.1 spore coat associated protein CotJA [Anaeromonas gelatinilytica]
MDNKMCPNDEYDIDSRHYKLAHAYIPYQNMCKIYDLKEALCKGTLFPELYMPYKKYDRRKKY